MFTKGFEIFTPKKTLSVNSVNWQELLFSFYILKYRFKRKCDEKAALVSA